MERRGTIERVSWGVYRLKHFPVSPLSQFMAASLWPQAKRAGARGTISHVSALAMYEMSDVNPNKVHITIPRAMRIRRTPPAYLVVHRDDLAPSEVRVWQGIPVTTPERTIRDCHADHLGAELIRQAIADGQKAGWLRPEQATHLSEELLG